MAPRRASLRTLASIGLALLAGAGGVEAATTTTTLPSIHASWSDGGSGIAPSTARLIVDGVDRTSEATVSVTALTWAAVAPVAEGEHTVTVTVSDRASNISQVNASFATDSVVPTLSLLAPTEGTTLPEAAPTLVANYADFGSNLDLATLQILFDGIDRTAFADVSATEAVFSPAESLPDGPHSATVSIRDHAGSIAQSDVSFAIDATAPTLAVSSPGSPGEERSRTRPARRVCR